MPCSSLAFSSSSTSLSFLLMVERNTADQESLAEAGAHAGPGEGEDVRDIHALTPSHPAASGQREPSESRSRFSWAGSEAENYSSMSREFNAMVVAGSTLQDVNAGHDLNNDGGALAMIGEEENLQERNLLAIVPDPNPISTHHRPPPATEDAVSICMVRKEEVETKISAWQTAEIAKINNRFKRQDSVINGWEDQQVDQATLWLKKYERKLEEKKARATEKTQNEVARARRKAEEKRASAEGKRGTKIAKVLELANFMRAVGRPPSKRSYF